MACTLHISYTFTTNNTHVHIFDIRKSYTKTGKWKMPVDIMVGCKGSCPDPEVPCPDILLTKKKMLTIDLSDKLSGEVLDDLDDYKDTYDNKDNMAGLRVQAQQMFKTLLQGVGHGKEGDMYGTKTIQDLMTEFADETVDKLKLKAKFINLCDCDVTTTTVLTTKALDYIVEEVEKDLQISLNP